MKRNRQIMTMVMLLVITLATSMIYTDVAAKEGAGKSKFGKPTLFSHKDRYVGVGYVNEWAGGLDVTGQYFIFDDISAQGHYTRISYDYGYGKATVSYISAAAVYHYKLATKGDNLGLFGGLGFASGKAKWEDDLGSSYEFNMGGLYWTFGLELIYKEKFLLTAGTGATGLGVSANYKF